MNEHNVSIIILNYNTKKLTLACLKSIITARTNEDLWRVIIVDNGSSDGSGLFLRNEIKTLGVSQWIEVVELEKNIGFSAGNNKGISLCTSKYILLLNSDTEVEKNSIQFSLKRLMSKQSIGAVSCKLVLPNGDIDPACHRGFPTPWAAITYFLGLESLFHSAKIFTQYHQWYKNLNVAHEVDAISGAFFMIKNEVIASVGLLDESFFMYGEDLDWSYRIKQKGWEIWFDPSAQVLHKKKQSGRSHNDYDLRKKTQLYFYETMKLFYKKHYYQKYPRLLTVIIIALINIRLALVNLTGK